MKLWKSISLSIFGGILLAASSVFLVGYTSAIAIPNSFSSFVVVWDIFVVQFLGFGVVAIAITYILSKVFKVPPLVSVAICLVSAVVLPALYSGTMFGVIGFHLILLLACLALGSWLGWQNA